MQSSSLTEEVIASFASVFVHEWEHYAVQQRNGAYWRVAEPLTVSLLSAHLTGQVTLGAYLLDARSTCSFAVFDSDVGLDCLVVLAGELAQQGIPTLLEASRRGGHLWVHFSEPTSASRVRSWLLPYALTYGIELYPKQDMRDANGSGSLLRVPLGVHRRSRGWYPFLGWSLDGTIVPVANSVMACCEWVVEHVERVQVPPVARKVVVQRPAPLPVKTCPVEYKGRGSIRAWCRSQDALAVIGQYVSLNGQGVGSCPFKEHHHRGDLRPSFQVFADSDQCWYCYTWGRGGDLFDFLCLYHSLSVQEGWLRLQEGMLW